MARSQHTVQKSQPLHCPRSSRDWRVQAVQKASQLLSDKNLGFLKKLQANLSEAESLEIQKQINKVLSICRSDLLFEKDAAATHQPRCWMRIGRVHGIPWISLKMVDPSAHC